MIKNVLWRFDGALFDTSSAMTFAVSQTLKQMGLLTPMNVIDGLVRQSFEHCVVTLAQRFKLNVDELRIKLTGAYFRVPPASQMPFPGVDRVCEYIHSHGGRNVVLAPFRIRVVKTLIEAHGLAPFFDKILYIKHNTTEEYGAAVVQKASKLCELDAAETLLVSNQAADIQSGYIAGFRTCQFGKADLAPCADYHCDDYSQLLGVLREIDNPLRAGVRTTDRSVS